MITTLSQLVAEVESGNNVFAVRHEPAWRYTTKKIIDSFHRAHRPLKMSNQTALTLLACSFGKYQVMGSVLYEIGFQEELIKFAASEFLQDFWFKEVLKYKGIEFSLTEILQDEKKRNLFARRYNGDASVYGARLMNVYHTKMKG